MLSNHYDRKIMEDINREASTRELYRYYREGVKHLNDVTEHFNEGYDFHLGEKMYRVLWRAKQDFDITTDEILSRGIDPATIKNVQPIVVKKSTAEIAADKALKNEAYLNKQKEAAKTSPVYITNADSITDEQVKKLILNSSLSITQVIDSIIDVNGIIGVGLISLGDNLKNYVYGKIPQK
jgi:hypothetical protein